MKTTFQVALGIIIAGVILAVGKMLFWGLFLKALTDDFTKKSTAAVTQLNKQHKERQAEQQYRIVTEVVKPKSLRECQAIYGNEINETTQACMEGSVLTVRTNEKGHREIIKREKYYHLEKRNVL